MRVRKRVAALGVPGPEPRWARKLSRLVAAADLASGSAVVFRRTGWALAGAAAAGGMLLGVAGVFIAPITLLAGGYAWLKRRAAARMQRIAELFPDAARGLADGLRSGMNLPQTLQLVTADAAPPLDAELRRVVGDLRLGRSVAAALGDFAGRCPVPGADLLALATNVAARSGANLAPIMEGIVESARDRDRLHREMRAATAQGRLTATVVAALPVAFLAIMGGAARGEVHFLLHEPAGWCLLGFGGALDAVGFAWIRKMVGRS